MQQNVISLPAMVKLALPTLFISKMNGVSVSRFIHQLDYYFKIIGLIDNIKMSQIAITLLEATAYNWFAI